MSEAYKKIIISVILLTSLAGCFLGIDGPDTISMQDAEKKIWTRVIIKSLECGYGPQRSLAFSLFGTHDYKNSRAERKSSAIMYDVVAVDHCLEAISFMFCRKTPEGKQEPYEDFLVRLLLTRYLSCSFENIDFLKFDELLEGRLL